MAKLNNNLKELSKNIRLKRRDIRNRCDSVTKFIKNTLNKQFDARTIGSYAIKTTVRQNDNEYDIDMALIFHNLSDDEVIKQKQLVYNSLKLYKKKIKDNPIVEYKEYAITLDFESSSSNNKYHFDYTIYNEEHFVVRGKQHIEKTLEESGNINFVNQINDMIEDDKEHFHVITRLLKHCVKNGKFNHSLTLPSIVITSISKEFIDLEWEGSDDFLESIISVLKNIKFNINNYKLPFPPEDNPFERFSQQQIDVTKNKIEEMTKIFEIANIETSSIKKWKLINEFFPGLKKPDEGSGNGEKAAIKRTTRSQGA